MNNEQLRDCFRKIRGQDKAAFTELYDSLKTPVFTVILRITRDRALSEDLMQDLFVKLYLSPPDPAVINLRAWIFTMARNLALNSLRGPRTAQLRDWECESDDSFADAVSLRIDLDSAMRRLTREETEILSLRIYGELKFREIAAIVGRPLGTVLWKYQKAIGTIREHLNGGNA